MDRYRYRVLSVCVNCGSLEWAVRVWQVCRDGDHGH